MKNIKLLIIDDDEDDYFLLTDRLNDIVHHNFNITWANTYDKGLNIIKNEEFDICLVDFLLGNKTGLDLLKQAIHDGVETPIILLTGKGNREIDREAMFAGATDYLIKTELEPYILERSIRYAISHGRALKAVKTSERFYRNIFHRSKDMIYLVDTGKGKFIDFNEQSSVLFGYTRDELMTMSTADLLAEPREREKLRDILLKKGELRDVEAIFQTKSGEKRICIINGVFYTEGGTMYHHGTVRDVTELRQMERNHLIAEKLATTGRFTRALAHEVRNPLTNIDLATEQLESENTDEELNDYIAIIKRNSHRIGKLITELLQTANPADMDLKKWPLNTIIEKAIEPVSDRILLKNIQIIRNFTPQNPLINADETKLLMAITNLIVNAVEAMTEGKGVLKIETELRGEQNLIVIEDNGCGMTVEQQNRLFEPYFTGKSRGLGLGMTTTMGIIQAHGGQLIFNSEVNKGTRFQILLPH